MTVKDSAGMELHPHPAVDPAPSPPANRDWMKTGRTVTHYRRLVEHIHSIEFFSADAIQLLMDNNEPVSLTGPDARQFIQLFAEENPSLVDDALLAQLQIPPAELQPKTPRPNPDLARLSEFMAEHFPEELSQEGAAVRAGKNVVDIVIEKLSAGRTDDMLTVMKQETARQLRVLAAEDLRAWRRRFNLLLAHDAIDITGTRSEVIGRILEWGMHQCLQTIEQAINLINKRADTIEAEATPRPEQPRQWQSRF